MSINLLKDKGVPPARQTFTWRDLAGAPMSKLDSDAFTRIRVLLMQSIESDAVHFSYACARTHRHMQGDLARIRRIEHHQRTLVGSLMPPDQTRPEMAIALEQAAVEVTARAAQSEPDPYQAQVYRFGVVEEVDHLYRFAALLDRAGGKDANAIVQSYTDIIPGRASARQHRHPDDDLRRSYSRSRAKLITKLSALTITALERQALEYYLTVGPMLADPAARQLYAEIASLEEQHVTQYTSLGDTAESWLEQWLLHEANEVITYFCCVQAESDSKVKKIWERFLDYELGHLRHVAELFKSIEGRDPAEILPQKLPDPSPFVSHRDFVRKTLRREAELSAKGEEFVPRADESEATKQYRKQLSSKGSPSERVAAGYVWQPGTELG
jgi:rubrerythrin